MAKWIRTGDPHGFNKERSSKFREGSQVQQTSEEGRKTYRPKHCGNNNKGEGNSPKTLNYKSKVDDPKAPFSIATTSRCRVRVHYTIPWIAPLYLSAKQGGIKYHFLSLWYDQWRTLITPGDEKTNITLLLL